MRTLQLITRDNHVVTAQVPYDSYEDPQAVQLEDGRVFYRQMGRYVEGPPVARAASFEEKA